MKKIKRTITYRKIEFTANSSLNHDEKLEVCPLCNSPIHKVLSPNDSTVEHPMVESPIKLIEKIADELNKETEN